MEYNDVKEAIRIMDEAEIMTELEEYQDFVAECSQPSPEDLVQADPQMLKGLWAATQMVNEGNEVLSIFEKAVRKGKEVDLDHLEDELGDTLWGLTCVANTFGLTLDDIINHNINKLVERQKQNEAA